MRDRTSKKKRGSRFLPAAMTTFHHFIHLSLRCSHDALSASLFPLLSFSHPSISSSFRQSIWLSQPCHPFSLSFLANGAKITATAGRRAGGGRIPALKARGTRRSQGRPHGEEVRGSGLSVFAPCFRGTNCGSREDLFET